MADKNQEIILGLGKLSIYDGETKVQIAYTRGGGKFTVTRTYRPISFDGLKAYASQEMIVIDEENVDYRTIQSGGGAYTVYETSEFELNYPECYLVRVYWDGSVVEELILE